MEMQKIVWDWSNEVCLRAFKELLETAPSLREVAKKLDKQFLPSNSNPEGINPTVVMSGIRRPNVIQALKDLYPSENIELLLRNFSKSSKKGDKNVTIKGISDADTTELASVTVKGRNQHDKRATPLRVSSCQYPTEGGSCGKPCSRGSYCDGHGKDMYQSTEDRDAANARMRRQAKGRR